MKKKLNSALGKDAIKLDDPGFPDMVMDDDEVLAAWEIVKGMLLEDEKG
jgi:hypothetical protein